MRCLIVSIALFFVPFTAATEANPISKVLQMIMDLQGTILSQASASQAEYDRYVAYCQDRSQGVAFEVKSAKANKQQLEAAIEEETASIGTLRAKIEDLAADVASGEADLKKAVMIRDQEADDFAAEEHDLIEIVDALERAISHFSKNGRAALLQEKEANSITDALSVMVDATGMSAQDASRLTALVQERSLDKTEDSDGDEDSDMELGAPAAAVHESHTGGVLTMLNSLYDRAAAQLSKVRETEAESRHNYEKLKQSLTNEMKLTKQDMHAAKLSLAESQEAKSVSEGDLETTSKDLERDITSKDALHHECMSAAHEFQATVNARQTEVNALAAAKKAIADMTSDAEKQTYVQLSFTQVASRARSHSSHDSAKFEVLHFVRKLAQKTKSQSLAQLASRMSSAVSLGMNSGQDPFEKVRGLISNMISQLESEAEAESSHKEYCDREVSATQAQKEDTTAELESLSAKAAQKRAASVKTNELIATLRKELASIARFKADAAKMRQEEKDTYEKSRAVMERGLKGIKLAVKILKEHYGKALGAEGGIISLLEVVEADFSQGLAVLVADEDTAVHYYDEQVKKNYELEAAAKEADLQYKIKEFKAMDKTLSETTSDLTDVQSRLNAITQFDRTLQRSCSSVPLSYEGRSGRREEEIAGLKQALVSLDGTALLETGSSRKLRGGLRH